MAKTREKVSHLAESFWQNPKMARQMMTYVQWQETSLYHDGQIIANGELYELKARHTGGGMYEITTQLPYWKNGKKTAKQA